VQTPDQAIDLTMSKTWQNEVQKLHGKLAVTHALWDYEREQIFETLGIESNGHVRTWLTEQIVKEIKDCIEGQRMLGGDVEWTPPRQVEQLVELSPYDPELRRAWRHFPDPVAQNQGFTWEYLRTELIEQRWIHVFVHDLHPRDNRRTFARLPARPGWKP
jgi:ribosomal protein S13